MTITTSLTFAAVSTSKSKGHGKALSPEANERVRDLLRQVLLRPEWKENQTALAKRLNMAQPSLSNILSGRNGAGVELAEQLAEMSGLDLLEVLTGKRRAPRFRELPGWAAAEAEARRRYRKIPDYAWRGAGSLMSASPPEHIDEGVVLGFATAWMNTAKDDEIEQAEREDIEAVMAEENRTKRAQPPLPIDPPPLPKARRRSKPTPTPTPPTACAVETSETLPLDNIDPAPKKSPAKR